MSSLVLLTVAHALVIVVRTGCAEINSKFYVMSANRVLRKPIIVLVIDLQT